MARKQDHRPLIRGTCTHRRTEADDLGLLLDAVTLDDWRNVVTGALDQAKQGDPRPAPGWRSTLSASRKPRH